MRLGSVRAPAHLLDATDPACGGSGSSRAVRLLRQSLRQDQINMPYVMVDVESDGPIPGDYSMICFGAIIVESELKRTFYGRLKPISDQFIPEALAVSGFTRDECLAFDDPKHVMERFRQWLATN